MNDPQPLIFVQNVMTLPIRMLVHAPDIHPDLYLGEDPPGGDLPQHSFGYN
jgi:hypothetical protein